MASERGACVKVASLVLGPLDNNVYVVGDDDTCFVVDPACDPHRILKEVGERKLDAIAVTHAHWDHTGALRALRDATEAKVVASAVEAPYLSGERSFDGHTRESEPCPVDFRVHDADVVEMGGVSVRVIATPGHTPGGISLFVAPPANSTGAPILFSGDTLFSGTHGRVDFEEGNLDAMRESLVKLASLPPETIVLAGHGEATTIARESGWLRLCCA